MSLVAGLGHQQEVYSIDGELYRSRRHSGRHDPKKPTHQAEAIAMDRHPHLHRYRPHKTPWKPFVATSPKLPNANPVSIPSGTRVMVQTAPSPRCTPGDTQ